MRALALLPIFTSLNNMVAAVLLHRRASPPKQETTNNSNSIFLCAHRVFASLR